MAAVSQSVWMYYKVLSDQLNWYNTVVYVLLFLVSWFIYKITVVPFLSPLRKIPGMSYNPIVGNLPELMRGETMEANKKMIAKCGPIFRYYVSFGETRLGLADPEAIRHVAITNNRNYVKPTSAVGGVMKKILGNGLVTSEGDIHAIHKRLMAPSFNNKSIAKMVPVFEKKVMALVEFWKRNIVNSKAIEVNVGTDLARTTLDIIGETAFGYDFNSLEQMDVASRAFWEIVTGTGLSYRVLIPFYFKLPFPDVLRMRRNVVIMEGLVQNIMKHKRELIAKGIDISEVTKDVLGMLMLARDEVTGQGLSDQDLKDEIKTLLLAGHETTAATMSWCLLTLASNPEIQEKARQEILSELQEDEPLTFENVEKLKFCGNVIKETLRLLPAVPITIRKALKGDVLPGNIEIPAGTVMTLCLGAMMRRADIYDDPETFRPERFEDKETESTFHNFLPFLIGPRMCLGYKFALLELRVMLVLLLRHLRFNLIPGVHFKRRMTITMKPNPPLRLLVSSTH